MAVGVAIRRSQMGRSLGEWASEPQMRHQVGPGFWMFLSGAPSLDVNPVLVHDDDPDALDRVLAAVAELDCPALLWLAGSGRTLAERAGDGWSSVGSTPFMAIDLQAGQQPRDPRVRRASGADRAAVDGLVGDAFQLPPEVATIATAMLSDPDAALHVWLLEDGDIAVSTVMTCRVDDAVTVWCMATASSAARRGYGRALLGEALARAADDGARVGLLAASDAGKPLYDATGWQKLEDWDAYTNAT